MLTCCGDKPTLEILVVTSILREHLPMLRVRVINVVDLMRLQSASIYLHCLIEDDFDSLFMRDKHVVFAFQGNPVGR